MRLCAVRLLKCASGTKACALRGYSSNHGVLGVLAVRMRALRALKRELRSTAALRCVDTLFVASLAALRLYTVCGIPRCAALIHCLWHPSLRCGYILFVASLAALRLYTVCCIPRSVAFIYCLLHPSQRCVYILFVASLAALRLYTVCCIPRCVAFIYCLLHPSLRRVYILFVASLAASRLYNVVASLAALCYRARRFTKQKTRPTSRCSRLAPFPLRAVPT
jgi:hypothetical protein